MKQETKEATNNSGRNQKFPKPIKYSYTFEVYETDAEFEEKGKLLTIEEQRQVRNTDAATRARQNAFNAAMDAAGIEKRNINNDEQLRLREFVKVLKSGGKYTDEQARALASTTLGIDWAVEDE